ncbi:hypothetical protein D3D01_16225 [Haloarcula sp. Atlit-7R]|nr:hypothetical protein D3D01_16225 [Haloarcula sp. Atlit-7R]
MITPVITTTLKYPDAVGEPRMLQSAQNGASPRLEPPRPGCEFAVAPLSYVEDLAEYPSSI